MAIAACGKNLRMIDNEPVRKLELDRALALGKVCVPPVPVMPPVFTIDRPPVMSVSPAAGCGGCNSPRMDPGQHAKRRGRR